MSLLELSVQDLTPYCNLVASTQSLGFYFEPRFGVVQGHAIGFSIYHDASNRIFSITRDSLSGAGICYFDPLLAAVTYPNAFALDQTAMLTSYIWAGQMNPDTGEQKIYSLRSSLSTQKVRRHDTNTLAIVESNMFPTAGQPTGMRFDTSAPDWSGVPGEWNGATVEGRLYFEGMTDGIPGITELTGANVYPKGLWLWFVDAGWYQTSGDADHCLIYVDPATAKLAGIETMIPGEARGTPNSAYAEQPVFGKEFDWGLCQFIPDNDSTFDQPKGELLLSNDKNFPFYDGTILQTVIRFVDYNPFGKTPATSSDPIRVHGRKTLTSELKTELAPIFDVVSAPTLTVAGQSPTYHPPTRRLMITLSSAVDPDTTENRSFLGSYSRTPEAVDVTPPAPLNVPRTNGITEAQAIVFGDNDEAVAGQTVTFTLKRSSTLWETLTVSGGIGTLSYVANPPIDADIAGNAELVIEADGSPLTEGVDYQVNNLTTGEIQWLTDQSGATLVTATYWHKATEVSPPFGTLLTDTALSDGDGRVFARVEYEDDDDIVGHADVLESALS